MNQFSPEFDEDFTLEPPGTIIVVGCGLLGIEAALYGRFLGYDVQVLEQSSVGASLEPRFSEDLPWMPNRCLSSLALSALQAQSGESIPPVPPLNLGEWVQKMLIPITETDLLRRRIHAPMKVTAIDQISVDDTETEDPDSADVDADTITDNSEPEDDVEATDVPPDFQLTAISSDQQAQTFVAEAVIIATGSSDPGIEMSFPRPAPYLFMIGKTATEDWEADLRHGWKEITQIFAQLGGRPDLDLYRPRRV